MLLAAAALLALTACEPRVEYEVSTVAGGDADRGRTAIRAYGCQTCHTIPGIPGADALVGPSLAGLGTRAYVGGVLSNTPENLVMWIQDPKAASPRTAMPDVGVTPEDARDIASYLYTLR